MANVTVSYHNVPRTVYDRVAQYTTSDGRVFADHNDANRHQQSLDSRNKIAEYCALKNAAIDGFRNFLLNKESHELTYSEADLVARMVFDSQKTVLKYLTPVVDFKKAHKITANKVNESNCC